MKGEEGGEEAGGLVVYDFGDLGLSSATVVVTVVTLASQVLLIAVRTFSTRTLLRPLSSSVAGLLQILLNKSRRLCLCLVVGLSPRTSGISSVPLVPSGMRLDRK